MTVLEADDLLFDADDVRRLLRLYGVEAADSEIDGILKESVGYPLGVAIDRPVYVSGQAVDTGAGGAGVPGGVPLL